MRRTNGRLTGLQQVPCRAVVSLLPAQWAILARIVCLALPHMQTADSPAIAAGLARCLLRSEMNVGLQECGRAAFVEVDWRVRAVFAGFTDRP